MDLDFATKFLGALFAIMNPFVNLPIFLALTTDATPAQQKSYAVKILLFSAIMCAILSIAGVQIIGFFGVSIDAFRVAGGLVLAGIAFGMLNGSSNSSHERKSHEIHPQETENDDISFYPMTFPMIVGPGTIATLIIYATQASSSAKMITFAGVLTLVLFTVFIVFYFASLFSELLSAKMRVIMTRLMGMILVAIAVEMILAGAKAILPGLAG